MTYFVSQLRLAADLDLPVVLHARKSVDQVTEQLRRFPGLRGMVHSFSGSRQQAERLLALGFYLGLSGAITYPRAKRLRLVAAAIPLDRLLIETDAPDQPPAGHRGQRNEPAYLYEIAATLAEIRGLSIAELAKVTVDNTKTLFALN